MRHKSKRDDMKEKSQPAKAIERLKILRGKIGDIDAKEIEREWVTSQE